MSLMGDIWAGLQTVMTLTQEVTELNQDIAGLTSDLKDVDRRVTRLETVVDIYTRGLPPPRSPDDIASA